MLFLETGMSNLLKEFQKAMFLNWRMSSLFLAYESDESPVVDITLSSRVSHGNG